ncbi:hypothetical protein [Paenibacillus sp. UNC451MF]|uniref:hypothetical protein n=1 Tax=Paenibacillus sp. UNC451MF TaxID=1449063 RepID=UPI00048B00DF|nr:hypothetical protein [Paenibacillus sp. UNC451MF]
MENITAFFKNSSDMNQAAAALREQGAIDIQLHTDDNSATSLVAPSLLHSSMMEEYQGNEHSYILQVVVESSRYRQAVDTLAQFGGQQ